MANRIDAMPTGRVVDPVTGEMELEWRDFFEEVVFGQSENSIGTVLSGVERIIAGTQPVADVLIEGRGSIVAEQNAQSGQQTAMNDFSLTTNTVNLVVSGSTGTLQTPAATLSISGGTAPYTVTSTFVSGDDEFTEVITGSPLGADGNVTVYYTIPWSSGLLAAAQEKITVTDDLGAMAELNLSVTAYDSSGIGAA